MSHVQDFNGLKSFSVLCQLFQTVQFWNYDLGPQSNIPERGNVEKDFRSIRISNKANEKEINIPIRDLVN